MSMTLAEGLDAHYAKEAEVRPEDEFRNLGKPWARPVLSRALKVRPCQVEAARERNKKHGCNVDYLPDGRPIITDANQRRRLMKIEGVFDRDAYC